MGAYWFVLSILLPFRSENVASNLFRPLDVSDIPYYVFIHIHKHRTLFPSLSASPCPCRSLLGSFPRPFSASSSPACPLAFLQAWRHLLLPA